MLLIEEANRAGARLKKCVSELGLSIRTFERWRSQGEHTRDMRLGAQHPSPGNALSAKERQNILDVCHSKEFSSLPPTQIVPALSDRGIYLASGSTLYRILRAHNEQHRRTRAQKPQKRQIPSHRAAARRYLGHRYLVAARTSRGSILLPLLHHGPLLKKDRGLRGLWS